MSSRNNLQAFENRECTIPLQPIDFGIPFVGTINEKIFYLKNTDVMWSIENITHTINDPNITVTLPERLAASEVQSATIFWKPSIDRRVGLDIEKFITGRLIIG